ncbi:MAG TPA: hypothetical protein VLM85_10790 [Polyangiaceae bacterium]|nr:hypothetical protein [Polyangiaceae bacterium]
MRRRTRLEIQQRFSTEDARSSTSGKSNQLGPFCGPKLSKH